MPERSTAENLKIIQLGDKMFTVYHLIWGIISLCLICTGLFFLNKYKPKLKSVLNAACVVCVLSELIKTLSVIKIVPSSDGTMFFPYIEMQHMPLHLCSLQILIIFYVRFTKNDRMRQIFLSFMYPSCTLGAFFALLLPSIFTASVLPQEAFIKPLAYQFFLYHTMLIILGLYIPLSKQVDIKPKNYFTTLTILGVISFVSLYINSALASATYVNEELVSVDYVPNFFFTYLTPIGIELTKLWHWYVYVAILLILAVSLIAAFYIPIFLKNRKK